jgi:rhodanese-related sulfurtransferase
MKRSNLKVKVQGANPTSTWFAIGALLLLALLGIVLTGCSTPTATAGTLPAEINVEQAFNLYQEGAYVLDVRTPPEWDEIHIPEANLIPLDQLESRVDEVPRDQEVVVICRSGNRSQAGRDILKAAGFENVTSVAGGMNDWSAAGYPTTP